MDLWEALLLRRTIFVRYTLTDRHTGRKTNTLLLLFQEDNNTWKKQKCHHWPLQKLSRQQRLALSRPYFQATAYQNSKIKLLVEELLHKYCLYKSLPIYQWRYQGRVKGKRKISSPKILKICWVDFTFSSDNKKLSGLKSFYEVG